MGFPITALCALLSACSDGHAPEVHELRGRTMGSFWDVKYVGSAAPDVVRATIEAVLDDYDRCFSLWRRDSEIAAFNRHSDRTPFAASATLRSVLALGLLVAERTGGAFDPTVQPSTRLYRKEKEGGAVTPAERTAALAHVGFRRVHLTPAGIVKDESWVELDLDGIVAGACVDALAARLRELAVVGAMLEVTGEVLCFGEKEPGVPWRIGVESPDGDGSDPMSTIDLRNMALCTSGSYRDHLRAGGPRRHHIFDPRTGENPTNLVLSVSVLARSCAVADALATALMVLGPDRARAVLSDWPGEPDLAAMFVVGAGDGKTVVRRIRWPG